jgi:hypothetical protein
VDRSPTNGGRRHAGEPAAHAVLPPVLATDFKAMRVQHQRHIQYKPPTASSRGDRIFRRPRGVQVFRNFLHYAPLNSVKANQRGDDEMIGVPK